MIVWNIILTILVIVLIIVTIRIRNEPVYQCEQWNYKVPENKNIIFKGKPGEDDWVIRRENNQLLTGIIINGEFKKKSAI
jgi:hypothetical protein